MLGPTRVLPSRRLACLPLDRGASLPASRPVPTTGTGLPRDGVDPGSAGVVHGPTGTAVASQGLTAPPAAPASSIALSLSGSVWADTSASSEVTSDGDETISVYSFQGRNASRVTSCQGSLRSRISALGRGSLLLPASRPVFTTGLGLFPTTGRARAWLAQSVVQPPPGRTRASPCSRFSGCDQAGVADLFSYGVLR